VIWLAALGYYFARAVARLCPGLAPKWARTARPRERMERAR